MRGDKDGQRDFVEGSLGVVQRHYKPGQQPVAPSMEPL